jgi:putative transposase
METNTSGYRDYRFPREIIGHGVWLYHRFSLGLCDVEELLAKRDSVVSCETIGQCCRTFGPEYARTLTAD